jgi:Zn-dependent protease
MIDELSILPILLFSVVVHEVAHGWMALRLGDTTARDRGRLTLNPLRHIDVVGSIIVPLLSLAASGRVFLAWARPVPVNGAAFTHPRRDAVLVSLVGPLANFALALACSVVLVLLSRAADLAGGAPDGAAGEGFGFLLRMFAGGISVNIMLAVFNLLPVPPLDGSHVLAAALPPAVAERYTRIGFAGVFALLFLMSIPAVGNAFFSIVSTIHVPFRAFIAFFL